MRNISLNPSALIDVKTLARDYLSVSLATVWRMRADGKLPEPHRLNAQCLRWHSSDIESFLAGFSTTNEQRPAATNGEASKKLCPHLSKR